MYGSTEEGRDGRVAPAPPNVHHIHIIGMPSRRRSSFTIKQLATTDRGCSMGTQAACTWLAAYPVCVCVCLDLHAIFVNTCVSSAIVRVAQGS